MSNPMVMEKDEAYLERVDSGDSMHRNIQGLDSTELHGYWKTPRFIGSLLAIVLMGNSLFCGYAMPVRHRHRPMVEHDL